MPPCASWNTHVGIPGNRQQICGLVGEVEMRHDYAVRPSARLEHLPAAVAVNVLPKEQNVKVVSSGKCFGRRIVTVYYDAHGLAKCCTRKIEAAESCSQDQRERKQQALYGPAKCLRRCAAPLPCGWTFIANGFAQDRLLLTPKNTGVEPRPTLVKYRDR
jgi:hypothetical protein